MQLAAPHVENRMTEKQVVRLAAVGDLHIKKTSQGQLQPLLAPVNEQADVLLLCGDLTDYGLPEEAQILAKELTSVVRIPIVAVLGNHDFESGQQVEVCRILTEAGVKVLDGEAIEIAGVGFAGVKGFVGGFGRGTLGAWGEPGVKQLRAGSDRRGDEARIGARAAAHARSASPCCTTRRSAPRWKASRSRSFRTSAPAGSKSR